MMQYIAPPLIPCTCSGSAPGCTACDLPENYNGLPNTSFDHTVYRLLVIVKEEVSCRP